VLAKARKPFSRMPVSAADAAAGAHVGDGGAGEEEGASEQGGMDVAMAAVGAQEGRVIQEQAPNALLQHQEQEPAAPEQAAPSPEKASC
jgi:hypothetical protein